MNHIPMIRLGHFISVPLDEAPSRALLAVMNKHADEYAAALEPYGIDFHEIAAPEFERMVTEDSPKGATR